MFDKAALVVAHPDDEALWFSSIVERVDEVVICFMDVPSRPDWSEGRRTCRVSYPLRKGAFLGLQESEVFNGADWMAPVLTHYGLEVSKRKDSSPAFSVERYRNNYVELRQQLSTRLKGCRNVFTHNPWGDYGHEEHVQVFRTIHGLQREFGFNIWFSNYCSNKSNNLMLEYISGFDNIYVTFESNQELGKRLMQLYKGNNCWTWFNDYTWFTQECFMSLKRVEFGKNSEGHIFPINYIKLDYLQDTNCTMKEKSMLRKVSRRLRRLVEKGNG